MSDRTTAMRQDFDKAKALTEELLERLRDEDLMFDTAISGVLTVVLETLLESSENSTFVLGVLAHSMTLAICANIKLSEEELH